MKDATLFVAKLKSFAKSLGAPVASALHNIAMKVAASVRSFQQGEVTPQRCERVERRLETLFREMARLVLERTVNQLESSSRPEAVTWEHRIFRPYARRERAMATRLGVIRYRRWLHRSEYSFFVKGIAPLDKRLGLTGNRVSPGVAHKLGRLAADLPQQAAIAELHEQFGVRLSVDAYRGVVEHLACEIQFRHDEAAIDQLREWIDHAAKSKGKHDVLLLVGRDGVHVPLRESWKEAACGTLAVYDRNRKRLGTIYLGEMPETKQVTMTKRLTKVIVGVLDTESAVPLRLRYVTDAGNAPTGYFQSVLKAMKHPRTGEPLKWSWGVDFYHACEHLSQLADSLYGTGTAKAQAWYKRQRHTLRHDTNGVRKVLSSAAQIRRRHKLAGATDDYERARGYLHRHQSHMDYATRRKAGDPIGSGITEAGCKVIFNQRMKQSGMRWSKRGGQQIVDLRTACRSRLWDRIWSRGLDDYTNLPETNSPTPDASSAKAA